MSFSAEKFWAASSRLCTCLLLDEAEVADFRRGCGELSSKPPLKNLNFENNNVSNNLLFKLFCRQSTWTLSQQRSRLGGSFNCWCWSIFVTLRAKVLPQVFLWLFQQSLQLFGYLGPPVDNFHVAFVTCVMNFWRFERRTDCSALDWRLTIFIWGQGLAAVLRYFYLRFLITSIFFSPFADDMTPGWRRKSYTVDMPLF